MTNGITKSVEEVLSEFGQKKPNLHYDKQYPASSFRIDNKTKEMLKAIKSDLGKSWNQTFLHLIKLHYKKQSKKH